MLPAPRRWKNAADLIRLAALLLGQQSEKDDVKA
jgi:hypothetical protein